MQKAKVFIYDEFDPEANAMLQALYSRSAQSVADHVAKVREKGSKRFMESYYVNYGHSSIGDCGTTTLFFEGVSILCDKAIQDHPLYSGQESSTRYIDFAKQPIFDPVGSAESQNILRKWIDFYVKAGPIVRENLKRQHPLVEGQKAAVWEKAIAARSFDILRSFLPAGVTTQLSWSTNLRQAHEKLSLLRHHPLAEVRNLAVRTLEQLKEKYPSSFSHKHYADQENYWQANADSIHYSDLDIGPEFDYECEIDNDALEKECWDLITKRPIKTNLPRVAKKFGNYRCRFLLDYGSFRDLQRHRNGLCQIPLLTTKYGFSKWYLDELPFELREEAEQLIATQISAIDKLVHAENLDKYQCQYFLPLGMLVACELVYDLPEMVYVVELRSGSTVHPTLRKIMHKIHNVLQKEHPNLKLYSDLSSDLWDIRRGEQDIRVIKK